MAPLARRLRWWVDGERTPRLQQLLDEPDRVLASSRSVAREAGGRKRFYRLQGPSDESALFVKVYNLPTARARASYFLRRSKARLEGETARSLSRRGLPVARPVAIGEERLAGFLLRSLAVIPELPARDLRAWLLDPPPTTAERRGLVEAFARFTRQLHEAGVDQDDTAPNNYLVDAHGEFTLIDFERCELRDRALPPARRWRLLAKLLRHDVGVPASDRLRFLRAYLGEGGSRSRRRESWRAIRREFLRLRLRDARRARHAAFKLGRHVRRAGQAWEMIARSDQATFRRDLDPRRARAAWVRAHQLERLNLPALRPVRLEGGRLELERPAGCGERAPSEGEVRIALRRFAPFGRFREPAEWKAGPRGALLANPEVFEVAE